MKKTLLVLAVVLASVSMFGQNISGKWYGKLNLNGKELRVVFNISNTRTGLKATMDSPDQNAFGIRATYASFDNSIIRLEISNAGIEYLGTLNNEFNFVGVLKQSGQIFPVILTTEKIAKK
jgi:uncharacterized protein